MTRGRHSPSVTAVTFQKSVNWLIRWEIPMVCRGSAYLGKSDPAKRDKAGGGAANSYVVAYRAVPNCVAPMIRYFPRRREGEAPSALKLSAQNAEETDGAGPGAESFGST